jgi:hypothetical protein
VKLELVMEVNEVGSYDGKPRVSLIRENERTVKADKRKAGAPDRQTWIENQAEIFLTRPQAQWFGTKLYRKVRVTFEDGGPLDETEAEQIRLDDAYEPDASQ